MQIAYFLICRNAPTHPCIHAFTHPHNTNTMNTPNIIPATSIIVVVISYPYECSNTEHILLGHDTGCQSAYLYYSFLLLVLIILYCGTGSQQSSPSVACLQLWSIDHPTHRAFFIQSQLLENSIKWNSALKSYH